MRHTCFGVSVWALSKLHKSCTYTRFVYFTLSLICVIFSCFAEIEYSNYPHQYEEELMPEISPTLSDIVRYQSTQGDSWTVDSVQKALTNCWLKHIY